MKKLALLVLLCPFAATADEGMWTTDNFPKAAVKKAYGIDVSDAWLTRVQRSSARLAGGCSGSFVSPEGLVLTNHHCANDCISKVSSAKKDFIADGFLAKTKADELSCPDTEINQLLEITDVTASVNKATAGLSDAAFLSAQKEHLSKLEAECVGKDKEKVRCDVVSLYHGGQYHLYRYKRFQDVRLAFAPEIAIANFGGDPDNFNFPRYDLDMALLRVYEDGRPAKTNEHLRWSAKGADAGDVLFVTGHPWRTSRLLTVAQLKFERDVELPARLIRFSELRGRLIEFSKRGAEQQRVAKDDLLSVENSLKARRGMFQTLLDDRFMDSKVAAETAARARISADPAKKKLYGAAWDEIAQAMNVHRDLYDEHLYLERGAAFITDLTGHARALVRAAEERTKPNEKRLREYNESALPAMQQFVLADAPIDRELETMMLGFSLSKMREALGVDHPVVKKILGKESPEDLAASLIARTKLADPAVRKKLWEGGVDAIRASDDPLIRFVLLVDADARAARKRYEDQVESVVKRNGELIAKVEFEISGTGRYPDATGTLRVSVGQVKGWVEDGKSVDPFTTIGGAFDRATGKDPFRLPPSWLGAQSKLDAKTRFNMVTTHDVIGGNSGSPVVDAKGELTGLVFDGNIHSLGGAYGYDAEKNRTVLVHGDGILEALRVVYGADALLKEMDAPAPKKPAGGG